MPRFLSNYQSRTSASLYLSCQTDRSEKQSVHERGLWFFFLLWNCRLLSAHQPTLFANGAYLPPYLQKDPNGPHINPLMAGQTYQAPPPGAYQASGGEYQAPAGPPVAQPPAPAYDYPPVRK